MPKYRIVTPKGASFSVPGGGYAYEKEALDPIDAEIVEAPANEAEFIAAARGADAIYAKGMRITKEVIDALDNCKVITLGSVGVDSVDVKAATARGIPVTNVPDTFIEEVADHAMTLLLAGFRRLVEQDKLVRAGRWPEGRPALLKIPRLMGQTLGFISFGRVARAVAKRAAPFGLRMMAYDPFIQETLISDHGVLPATLSEVLSQSDFISMHAPARPEVHHMLGEKHFKQMKPSDISRKERGRIGGRCCPKRRRPANPPGRSASERRRWLPSVCAPTAANSCPTRPWETSRSKQSRSQAACEPPSAR